MVTKTRIDTKSILPQQRELYKETILDNHYVKLKPYAKQSLPIWELLKPNQSRPHSILVGDGGYGGKTILGSILASQYLDYSQYSCLVTRRTYGELTGVNSIWRNLNDWLEDTCKINKSNLTIKAPSGAEIVFRAFLYEEDKYKVKSESYTTIINDEASELLPNIIRFLYRSLRKDKENKIPLSMIHLSNPSLRAGSDYLHDTFVKGKYNHYSLDWRHNPYIDQVMYRNTLEENMDYIDLQHQLYGKWGYKPAVGDLISLEDINRQTVDLDLTQSEIVYNVLSIDLAGEGEDKTAIVNYLLLDNGLAFVEDLYQTVSAYPEENIYRFIEHKLNNYNPNIILIEQEGGSRVYSDRHWIEELTNFGIPIQPVQPVGTKYNRARPLIREMRKGWIKINKKIQNTKYKESQTEENYHNLLSGELIQLAPKMKESPNLVDCLSQARNYIVDDVLNSMINNTGMQVAT
jgi:hypothetical protein